MKLYFVRHGHMDANPDTIVDPVTGQIDKPLDTLGTQQAETVAKELKDVSFDVLISSPLKRAYQTAESINKYHKLPIEIEKVWRERDTGGYVTAEVWNDLFNFDKTFLPENTEGLHDFFQRVYGAVDKLKEKYADKTVLIVSHGGVHQALYAYVNKLELVGNVRNSPLHNCEVRAYEIV